MIVIEPHIKALIFDCDGTLADTMPLHYEAWQKTLEDFGASCPLEFLRSRNGIPTEGIISDINKEFGYHIDPVAFSEAKEVAFLALAHLTKPIEPVVAVAHQYAGQLRMACVSGGRRGNVEQSLRLSGVLDLMEEIITADDKLSPKPAPDMFLEAAKRLGVPPHLCHVFEDADPGIEGARSAGMAFTDVRLLRPYATL